MASIGLDSACTIILDVMEYDSDDRGLVIPICCFYSIRAARRRVQERSRLLVDGGLSRDVDVLLRAEGRYRETWVF